MASTSLINISISLNTQPAGGDRDEPYLTSRHAAIMASAACSPSLLSVSQEMTDTRMAWRPRHLAPPAKAMPSACR
ncbi:hypothetical protein [Mesorhizobium sp. 131-2-1]|uniref:hypothetical protein n=1 Tax=Mesorhizobium sp. 131-2-1 TaxID=2744518 RepID=UPI0019275F1A|nr:hypothetical protein [Mesorhizobium sp. 131-2-1]